MIRRPPRSTQSRSSAASDVYKRQLVPLGYAVAGFTPAAYQRCRLQRPSSGSLILGWVSHLDAFSAYPFPTELPGGAVGTTTGTPAVGPTRSSRTKARSPQTSPARNR